MTFAQVSNLLFFFSQKSRCTLTSRVSATLATLKLQVFKSGGVLLGL